MKILHYWISGIRRRQVVIITERLTKDYKLNILENNKIVDYNYESYENYGVITIYPKKHNSNIDISDENEKHSIQIIKNRTINVIKNKFSKKTDKKYNSKKLINICNVHNINGKTNVIFEYAKKPNINIKNNEKNIKFILEKIADNIYICSFKHEINGIYHFNIIENKYVLSNILIKCNNSKNTSINLYPIPFIGLDYCYISGINKPILKIEGISSVSNLKYYITGDNKKLKINKKMIKEDIFDFNIKLNKEKNIVFGFEYNDINVVIAELKNTKKVRINQKINNIKKKLSGLKKCCKYIIKGISYSWKEYHFLVPPKVLFRGIKTATKLIINPHYLDLPYYNPFNVEEYNKWLNKFENFDNTKMDELSYKPLISLIIPVYNVKKEYLIDCLDSILKQTYTNFEICIADDCSTNKETINTLKEYEKKDNRIKVVYREKNGHISAASNSALEIADGEYVALVDNDDTLSIHALMEVVKELNKDKSIDFIYSDEDKINLEGKRCDPHFKPDFSPDTLLSLNYICHLSVIRKKIVDQVGGFEIGLEGAQDHDLFLKISEKTTKINHISKILYHWRMIPTSTSMKLDNKDYASDKGKIAIENALKRRGIKGVVEKDEISKYYIVKYDVINKPLISIIIPTKDYADTLNTCLKSIYSKTTYDNYEIIVINNNSAENKTFKLFKDYKEKYKNFRIIDANFEFNYSKINNLAVNEAKGDYILLLNNDTEVITPNWLELMVGYAMQKHIGCVGAKLLYPDDTVQHAGVVLGLGGVASHILLNRSRKDPGIYGRLRVPYNYSAVTAACLMIEKNKFLKIGGLEENLKVAYNDVDFNIKTIKNNYNNICLPQVELHHFESKSRGLDTSPEKYKRFLSESKYMFDKWEEDLINDKYYNSNYSNRYWYVLPKNKEKKISFELIYKKR